MSLGTVKIVREDGNVLMACGLAVGRTTLAPGADIYGPFAVVVEIASVPPPPLSARDALAGEIRSWRRRRDRIVVGPFDCEAASRFGLVPCRWPLVGWKECEWAARGLRGLATAFRRDPADRAARIALARAVAEAALAGELAPDFAAAREIARVKRAGRSA